MYVSFDKDIFGQRLWCIQTHFFFLFAIWISCTICFRDFLRSLGPLALCVVTCILLVILFRFIIKSWFFTINQSNLINYCYLVHALIGIMPFYVCMSSTDRLVQLNMCWLLIAMQISTSLLLHVPFLTVVISACLNFAAITLLPCAQIKTVAGLEASFFYQGSALVLGIVISYLLQKEVSAKFITLQKLASKAEKKIEKRAQELRKAYLKELLHEIGTPLMVLSLGNESLQEMREISTDFKKILKSNTKAIEMLTRLRERALDFTKQSEGVLHNPNYGVVNIRKLVYKRCSEIMTAFNSSKCHERVQMTYDVEENVPKYIKSDADFIWDMLCCLLSNSRKFITKGKIKTVVSYSEQEQVISFKVLDTGKGVDEENRGLLFKPFTQFQSGSGGTGLGLYSVKLKAEALNGKVGYMKLSEFDENIEGLQGYETGSVFWFSIPYLMVEEKHSHDGKKHRFSSSVICSRYKPSSKLSSLGIKQSSSPEEQVTAPSPGIVEMECSLKTTVHRKNKMCVVAPNLKYLKQSDNHSNSQEIVSEFSTLRRGVNNQEPVARVSSHLQPNSVQQVNLNTQIVPMQTLTYSCLNLQTVESVDMSAEQLKQRNSLHAADSQSKDTTVFLEIDPVKRHPVLLIEDEVSILKTVSRMLRKQGYLVDTAENGKVGLQKLISTAYSCVFCDITMPEMDGYETLLCLRKWEEEQDCDTYTRQYVCALSANSDEGSRSKAIHCGFDNFLSKPTNIKTIMEEIRKAEGLAATTAANELFFKKS